MSRRHVLTGLVAAGALAVSACGIQLEPSRGEPPAALDGAVDGGELRVGITAPGRIDPMSAATPGARMITQTMCDTLVELDPVTRQVVPGLVKDWVEAEGGTFLTMLPLHDVTFTDGQILKGRDLEQSLRAVLAHYNDSPYRALAEPFRGGVLGSEQEEKSDLNPLLVESADEKRQSAQLLNDYDAQYKANPANSAASRLFADPAMAPVSHAAMQADFQAFQADPRCVGPYMLTEPYQSDATTITLVRNPEYFAQNLAYSGGGRGYAESIIFEIFESQQDAFAAYQQGKVDIVEVPDDIALNPDKLPAAVRGDVADATGTRMEYLGIPIGRDPLLDSPVVRQALSLALDRQTLSALAGLGTQPATGFFPPSLAIGASDEYVEMSGLQLPQCARVSSPTGDVAAAKKLLSDAGISLQGETITLNFELSRRHRELMKEVARQWSEAFGVTVTLDSGYEWTGYRDTARFSGGFSGPFRFTWGTDGAAPFPGVPEIQTYLQQVFMQPRETNTNWTGWINSEVDSTVADRLASTNDQRTRNQLVDGIAETICEEMPYIPLYSSAPSWLIRSESIGHARTVSTGVDGLPLLRELYVKPDAS